MLRRNIDALAILAIVVVYGIAQLAGVAARRAPGFDFHRLEDRASTIERKVGLLGTKLEAVGERITQRVEERARRFEEKAQRFDQYLERRFQ